MNGRQFSARLLATVAACSAGVAEVIRIEPDAFAEGAVLTNADPRVTLTTTLNDNQPLPLFVVTAATDSLGYAPSGDKVFAHVNVPFFNDARRLRLDFAGPVQEVSIAFAGGDFFDAETGILQAYDVNGAFLQEYISNPLSAGEFEVMRVTRPQAEIVWAVAYTATGAGNFGRLDDLEFVTPASRPPGDTNCDGLLNFFDIDPFVVALLTPDVYPTLYPNCQVLTADVNGDSRVDFFDIDPFLELLFD